MSFTSLNTAREELLGPDARSAIAEALRAKGSAVVLCPSFKAALRVERELAAASLSFGVLCTTPSSWCELRWALYGDGRVLVSTSTRSVLLTRLLEGDVEPLESGTGTVQALGKLAQKALPWLPQLAQDSLELTWGEAQAVQVCLQYANELHAANFVEPVEALCKLPSLMSQAGATLPTFVFAGYEEFDFASQHFVDELARYTDVLIVSQDGWDNLSPQAPEITTVLKTVFGEEAPEALLEPTGAVALLEPAGPVAEARLAATYIEQLAASGAASVCVVAQNPEDAWRNLAPKLFEHGIAVRAQISVPIASSRAAAGFMRFAACVARLIELEAIWPEDPKAAPPVMDWWPPLDILDFLELDFTGVSTKKLWRLDTSWRGNRVLKPTEVLDELSKPFGKEKNKQVADALKAIRQGHLAAAAGFFYRAAQALPPALDAQAALNRQKALSAFAAIGEVGKSLKACGVELSETSCSLSHLVQLAAGALQGMSTVCRPELACEDAACTVTILSPAQAAALSPQSTDAVLWLGCDSVTSAVRPVSGALVNILSHLGIEQSAEPLDQVRLQFCQALAAARSSVAFSKARLDKEGEETYPAAMLSEVLALYNYKDAEGKTRSALTANAALQGTSPKALSALLDEGCVEENIGATQAFPEAQSLPARAQAGQLNDELRQFVVPPRDGDRKEVSVPTLSASQIESYLQCPYKWFTLRRLRLNDCDALFSNAEIGSFVHFVLEATHRRLMVEAAAEQGLMSLEALEKVEAIRQPEDSLFWFDPKVRLEASRVTPQNLEHASDVLHEEFVAHLADLYEKGTKKSSQALVPHTASERRRLDELEKNLMSVLEYESDKFQGFEPRLFEAQFGDDALQVEYAGVKLSGSIDRVDINERGQAIIIDYKHKKDIFGDYALSASGDFDEAASFELPHYVQTLIYAQVARHLLEPEGIEVVGAVYFATRPEHCITGALNMSAANAVWPLGSISEASLARVTVPVAGAQTFYDLLDRTEEAIRVKIERLRAGMIEAKPSYPEVCEQYCPVTNCEMRGGADEN